MSQNTVLAIKMLAVLLLLFFLYSPVECNRGRPMRFRPGIGGIRRPIHKHGFYPHDQRYRIDPSRGRPKIQRNPYLHFLTKPDKYIYSRKEGWHSASNDDEYHTPEQEEDDSIQEEEEEVEEPPWRSQGSFTGDLRLSCLEKNPRENCAYGIVEMYHKELASWGLICSDTWKVESSKVVCNYLNYRKAKTVKVNKSKAPGNLLYSPHFLRQLECEGDEWTLTECIGEPVNRNYTCAKNRLVAVKCSGRVNTPDEEDEEYEEDDCDISQLKCKAGDRCIDPNYICDGMADCPWGSDEQDCDAASCKKDEYWCGPSGGGCIRNKYFCDGESDCIDESDERECEQYLSSFTKTTGRKLRTNNYQVTWENMNAYLCAQKCTEETSFTCSSFDFNKGKKMCMMISVSTGLRFKSTKNWEHYEKEGQEDCIGAGKYRCRDGSCIFSRQVCNSQNDCTGGEEEKECEPLLTRLKGGAGPYEGRVEVSKGLKYGLVCDTHWTINEANVVCRQLGYTRGASEALKGGSFDGSDRKYVLDDVYCTGLERNLEDCRHAGWGKSSCKIDHEAGVVCITVETTTTPPITITSATRRPTSSTPTTASTGGSRECGIKPDKVETMRPTARIVGGTGADPHEWPWQVGIWLPWSYWCGGTLIDPCWVLTAAHCFVRNYSLNHYTIRLGDHLTGSDDGTEQEFKIARIIQHNYNATSKNNDIALVELRPIKGRCAKLTSEVRLVCVPKSPTQFNDKSMCHISGWGKVSMKDALPYTLELQEAPVPIISDRTCKAKSEYTDLLTSNMFCAGFLSGGIDTCQGDSGGPLSCQDAEDGLYYVWGIVSWGNGCARPKAPGVYARVGNYIDWIERNTGINF